MGGNVGKSVGRSLCKLSATFVLKVKESGYYGDGGGLWLQVAPGGAKSWIFRFTLNGKAREMGLGPLHTVPLAMARDKSMLCRQQVLEGIDPIDARKSSRLTAQAAAARVLTFDQCAEQYIESHRAGWRNAKHAEQWTNTLATYVTPVFGRLPVAEVDTALVMKVLQPIWTTKTETANRVRGRIESVLAWATVRQHRSGDNPARWRGHLDQLLAAPSKVTKVENHAALPYVKINEFMRDLKSQEGTAARAVELIILTASRTSEILNARRTEVDLQAAVLTIPADRMKSGREHRVPLSKRAITLITQALAVKGSDYLFPGAKEDRPLSNMAGLKLLARMGRTDITVHGFRSTFRDWAAEQTSFPREVAEAALAHVLADKTEAAYQRGDLLVKRAKLMQAWSDYCDKPATVATVVDMPNRGIS